MQSKILMLTFFLISLFSYSQNEINGYKYIIVPKKFDFQKGEDKYQLNSLTKFLFNKEGFMTLFESDKTPQDMYDNPCLGLKANVKDLSNMFSTKVIIELSDCRSAVVFTSIEGKSKVKDFKRGYQEAIRKAFESVKKLDYKYDTSLVSSIKMEPTIEEKTPKPIAETQPNREEIKPVSEKVEIIEEIIEDQTTTNEEFGFDDIEVTETVKSSDEILYAQAKSIGFQLVDSTPSVVYLLQKSSIKDVYILKNKNGIIYKKDQKWIVEYYENDKLLQKELNIKF